MALLEELGTDVRECVRPRGEVRVWTLAPTVYVTWVKGHMEGAHADLMESYGQRRIALGDGKLRVFHDWMDMTGYDSHCQQRLTSWSLKHLDAYDEVHICLRSKIVAMGVQVANIALRGLIHTYTERTRVEAELRRVLRTAPGAPQR